MSQITTLAVHTEFQAGWVDESGIGGFLDSFFRQANVVVAQPFSEVEISLARICRRFPCLRSVYGSARRREPEWR